MFVTVRINSEIADGTLVCHDACNVWRATTSSDNAPLGYVESTEVDEEGVNWACVILAGVAFARAGVTISQEGGWLASDDSGRAVVTLSEDCGLIAPQTRGQELPHLMT